jgi:transposase
MIQITPQMRILVAVEPADFRCGIDGLARVCRAGLSQDPFSGALIVFRNRRGTAIKILAYDGQGFWICHKRLSSGRFRHWPNGTSQATRALEAHELTLLLRGGDPSQVKVAPTWRPVSPAA